MCPLRPSAYLHASVREGSCLIVQIPFVSKLYLGMSLHCHIPHSLIADKKKSAHAQ